MLEKLLDKTITSEATKRYISAAFRRYGTALGVYLVARYGAKFGIGGEALAQWNGLIEQLAGPAALVVIEIWSIVRARSSAKTLETAIQSPSYKSIVEVKAEARAA